MNGDDNKPATKADLTQLEHRLDQRIDGIRRGLDQRIDGLDQKIDGVRRSLAVEIVKTQADIRDMKAAMATKDDIGRVLKAIDAIAKKSETKDRAVVLHGHALTEVQTRLNGHEKRLTALEKKP